MEDDSTNPENKSISEEPRRVLFSKWRIIKNLTVICFCLVILFTAYNGLSMLQSTMNQNQGIGVASQAIIYAGFCVSALLFPKYTIKKLGCKYTLLVSMSCYIPYVAANFYFNWFTMVPSAILVGLAASLLWSAECTYFNQSAVMYSTLLMKERCDNRLNNSKLNVKTLNNSIDNKNSPSLSNTIQQGSTYEILDYKTLLTDSNNGRLKTNLQMLHPENNCKDIQDLTGNSEQMNANLSNDAKSCFSDMLEKNSTNNDLSKNNKNSCKFIINSIDMNEVKSIDALSDSNKYELSQIDLINSDTNSCAVFSKIHSNEYSKVVSSVTALFFGLFGLIYRTSDIWSNLMSYYVLQDASILDNITENGNCSCGASFCNAQSNCFEHNLAEPSQQMRNILTGISVMLGVLSVILVFFLLDEIEEEKQPTSFSFNLAMATCTFARRKEAILLIPLSSYIGLQQAFYIADFTKSYIACAWGVYHVGLVTLAYGLSAGLSSTLSGLLVKHVGRIPVMMTGALVNAGVSVFLLVWNPVPDHTQKFFIAAAVWGIAVGILWSQLRAFYGVIFKDDEEAAFACFYLWDSIGYCLSFSYSNYICTYSKIYILLAISSLGVLGYLKTESLHTRDSKK